MEAHGEVFTDVAYPFSSPSSTSDDHKLTQVLFLQKDPSFSELSCNLHSLPTINLN